MSSTTTATRHELLARLDELDQLADAINIPEGLTLERSYGAMLMANQLLEAIKAQKKAIRAALAKLI